MESVVILCIWSALRLHLKKLKSWEENLSASSARYGLFLFVLRTKIVQCQEKIFANPISLCKMVVNVALKSFQENDVNQEGPDSNNAVAMLVDENVEIVS